MTERLFDIDEEYPEVPILRPPARRKGEGDARFKGEYPPEWKRCPTCGGSGLMPREVWEEPSGVTCETCLGMGNLKGRVRLEAGHRCLRCGHPYIPKADAKMLGVERSWREGGWSACDERCSHGGPLRFMREAGGELGRQESWPIRRLGQPKSSTTRA